MYAYTMDAYILESTQMYSPVIALPNPIKVNSIQAIAKED